MNILELLAKLVNQHGRRHMELEYDGNFFWIRLPDGTFGSSATSFDDAALGLVNTLLES